MDGVMLTTPEKLISASQEFSGLATQVSTITQQMTEIIQSLQNTWAGEANIAYTGKFTSLQDDMTKIYKMISEHSTDLQEMARNYIEGERTNQQTAEALTADVIS